MESREAIFVYQTTIDCPIFVPFFFLNKVSYFFNPEFHIFLFF